MEEFCNDNNVEHFYKFVESTIRIHTYVLELTSYISSEMNTHKDEVKFSLLDESMD